MAPHTAAPGLVGRSWPKLKRTALGSQPPAKNLLRLSQLYFANLKNRTGIGSHLGAGKDQAFQANKPAMSGGLNYRGLWRSKWCTRAKRSRNGRATVQH